MMPWVLIDAASSDSETSSMRVRGWYLPAWTCASLRLEGALAGAAGASWASPPSSASRPRPSPFSFFVAMMLSWFYECLQCLDALDHLGAERDIRLRPLRRWIEHHAR